MIRARAERQMIHLPSSVMIEEEHHPAATCHVQVRQVRETQGHARVHGRGRGLVQAQGASARDHEGGQGRVGEAWGEGAASVA